MREPDDVKPVGTMDFYNSSRKTALDMGVALVNWEVSFHEVYGKIEDFDEAVVTATRHANKIHNISVANGINEKDYV